jgi:hypothetical protein
MENTKRGMSWQETERKHREKKEVTADFSSIDTYKRETVIEEEKEERGGKGGEEEVEEAG